MDYNGNKKKSIQNYNFFWYYENMLYLCVRTRIDFLININCVYLFDLLYVRINKPISIKIFYYGKNCYTWRNYVEIIHSG